MELASAASFTGSSITMKLAPNPHAAHNSRRRQPARVPLDPPPAHRRLVRRQPEPEVIGVLLISWRASRLWAWTSSLE